jgi:hypothetical protein
MVEGPHINGGCGGALQVNKSVSDIACGETVRKGRRGKDKRIRHPQRTYHPSPPLVQSTTDESSETSLWNKPSKSSSSCALSSAAVAATGALAALFQS